MRIFHQTSLLTISAIFAAAYAAPAPGWQMIRTALMPATKVIQLDTRQASNETAPPQASTPAGNITITPCMTAQPGDTCDGAASQLAVSLSDFLAANPSVDSACDNLLAGVVYCA